MGWFASAPSRDPQKSGVYAAERKFLRWMGKDHELARRIEEVADVQKYVDSFVRKPAFRARFHTTNITVHDGRGRRSAGGWHGNITLPSWSRYVFVVLHEIAHAIAPNHAHGDDYCRTFVQLVEIATDRHTAMLFEGGLIAHGCAVRSEPKPRMEVAACQQRPKPLTIVYDKATYHTHPDRVGFSTAPLWERVHTRTGICRYC